MLDLLQKHVESINMANVPTAQQQGRHGSLVREAALSVLLELAQDKTSGCTLPDQDKLKDILKSRIEGIGTLVNDNLHAAREEQQVVDFLRFLERIDAPQQPPLDAAGKMFEPVRGQL